MARDSGMTGPQQAANPFADGCAWIDGQYLPVGEARIPILDTGFVRSDLTDRKSVV